MRNWLFLPLSAALLAHAAPPAQVEIEYELRRNGSPIAEGPWSAWWDPWGERILGAIHRINVEQARAPEALPPTLLALMRRP